MSDVYSERLVEINNSILNILEEREREFARQIDLSKDLQIEDWREIARVNRFIRQVFVLKKNGRFIYPLLNEMATSSDRGFMERTLSIWESGVVLSDTGEGRLEAPYNGWHTWFWGDGVHFLYWQLLSDGRTIGVEIARMALLAEIVGNLPATSGEQVALKQGRIVLADTKGDSLYQWGEFEPLEDDRETVSRRIDPPMGMWTLKYYSSSDIFTGGLNSSTLIGLSSGLVAVGLLLLVMAWYFYRENSRELHLASQRVTFVNQVSHELKAPLTNIRMYAELLKSRLPDAGRETKNHLEVVVSESQRLSRLINNVLIFDKNQRHEVAIRKSSVTPDEIIEATIEDFRVALNERGIEVEFKRGASTLVRMDKDAFEQILSNLISNVEKYAVKGKYLGIQSSIIAGNTLVVIRDRGPGISKRQGKFIFKPFARISNRLTDGVSGTGIGLAIARALARKHGGELSVTECRQGASFKLMLETPKAEEGEAKK